MVAFVAAAPLLLKAGALFKGAGAVKIGAVGAAKLGTASKLGAALKVGVAKLGFGKMGMAAAKTGGVVKAATTSKYAIGTAKAGTTAVKTSKLGAAVSSTGKSLKGAKLLSVVKNAVTDRLRQTCLKAGQKMALSAVRKAAIRTENYITSKFSKSNSGEQMQGNSTQQKKKFLQRRKTAGFALV